jgi:hypothetical protein
MSPYSGSLFYTIKGVISILCINCLRHLLTVFCILGVESKLGPLGTSATYWPIAPAPGDCEDGEFWWNEWQGKPKYSEKT